MKRCDICNQPVEVKDTYWFKLFAASGACTLPPAELLLDLCETCRRLVTALIASPEAVRRALDRKID